MMLSKRMGNSNNTDVKDIKEESPSKSNPASPDRTVASGVSGNSEGNASASGSHASSVEIPLANVVIDDNDSALNVSIYNVVIAHNNKSASTWKEHVLAQHPSFEASQEVVNNKSASTWKQHVLSQHPSYEGNLTTAITNDATAKSPKRKKKKKKKGWREYTDLTTGKKYYSDGITTTWERPADFGKSSSPSRSHVITANAVSSPETTNHAATGNSLAGVSEDSTKMEKAKSKKKKKGWREYTDKNTGQKYYSDGETTTWDRPVIFPASS